MSFWQPLDTAFGCCWLAVERALDNERRPAIVVDQVKEALKTEQMLTAEGPWVEHSIEADCALKFLRERRTVHLGFL